MQIYPNAVESTLSQYRNPTAALCESLMVQKFGSYTCEYGLGDHDIDKQMRVCGKRFHTLTALNQHKLEHCLGYRRTLNRMLECEDCHQQFKYLHEIDHHKRKHLRELNYRCPLCPRNSKIQKSFRFREEFVDHLKLDHPDQKDLAFAEVEKLWEQRQWVPPENGLQAYQ
mmetsp:Transcript_7835/g.13140  ORF Transcript_7835/g.13140 Transcript_7835/m.13140 type:complete len:170 (-) Transcript_7835:50-559(-)